MMQIKDLTPKHFFLDIEVDSVPEQGDTLPCITQIAVRDPSRDKIKSIFNAYVEPPKELRYQEYGNTYTDGNQRVARDPFKKVWPQLVSWINEGLNGHQKAVIIMHNGFKHDWPILKDEIARVLSKTNLALPRSWVPFDTLYLKNALHIPGDGSLTGLCHTLGAPVLKAHDAAEDVKMTEAIFDKMIGSAPLKKVLVAAVSGEHPVRAVAEVIKGCATPLFVFFDFESTGLFPGKGQKGDPPRAVQLAGYIPKVDKVFNALINPGCAIPRASSAVHGIYDGDVEKAPSFKAVWLDFEKFIHSHMVHTASSVAMLGGHNVWGYDFKLYESESERDGVQKKHWKSIDTLALARNQFKGIKGLPRKGFFKQEYLAPLLGINITKAHDAASDVIASWGLLQKMTAGVDENKLNKAVLSTHPVLGLGQLCHDEGSFKAKEYWDLYNKGCSLVTDMAHSYFQSIENPQFFIPKNLAAILDISVAGDESDLYTQWRIFLKLSQGVDRQVINKVLNGADPLRGVLDLCHRDGTFDSRSCLEFNKKACQSAISLARELFPSRDEDFFEPKNLLAALGGMPLKEEFTYFDAKRIFLALTKGVPKEELNKALSLPEVIEPLSQLVKEFGAFDASSLSNTGAIDEDEILVDALGSKKRFREDDSTTESPRKKKKI
jgi:DNA polymerase III epsilon subunit-like protein